MMSANAVLMKFFKLPPAVRMMLALLGFGSLASILFRFLPGLRSGKGLMWMLIIFGVGIVLFLIFWLIRRLFFRRKSSELSEALESQGPTRGDIAEQEQIYREKFKGKLAELKTNGLNVYKLPWFVLMGEPGCGKTASLIHSGLDFPLGKDEVPGFGGTRNYNWWFTNDAVVLDTAGRIAFQEEGTTDKVEWEYFLKLLKTHRTRCPVNGVVIALPADKLLRDTSEERAQKATILRERLRQVHQALGVRFPTFVLVTKMDLAGGFSEFFEEIRVDLLQRNQMFGWSRPGEFEESYDPAGFSDAFESVYGRVRDWSMRYLQRKATEEELGMIVTFPESFRQLRDPLNDYITTIFQKSPLLEPPFFRGFYFTSAVQEGAPIFDIFAKSKAGITVTERPTKAVDSKAFFIHDFYTNKVFPEHGLVFRSARHVSLNKRMRRLVWYGSAAMVLLMIGMFIFGITGVHSLLTSPRDDCRTAGQAIEKGGATFDEMAGSLHTAKALGEHYKAYSQPWAGLYARLLFIGADIHVPESYVGQIHSHFVLDCVVKPIMAEVEDRLANTELAVSTDQATRERYVEALRVYTKWYGEVVGQSDLSELDSQEAVLRRTEFEALLRFLSLAEADLTDAADQFETALTALSEEPRSFAREVLRDGVGFDEQRATETILAAIDRITESWKPLTQLSADNTNAMIRFWADFADRVGALRARYNEVLTLSEQFARSDQYEPAAGRFMELSTGVKHLGDADIHPEIGTLHEAYFNLMTFLDSAQVPETADHVIIRFGDLLNVFASRWNAEYDELYDALQHGAPDTSVSPQARVYEALAGGRDDLTTAFELSLEQIREKLGLPPDVEPLTYYVDQRLIDVIEANPPQKFDGPARLTLARDALGPNQRLKRYLIELRDMIGGQQRESKDLEDLRKWTAMLRRLTGGQPPGKLLDSWFSGIGEASEASRDDVIRQRSGLKEHPFWRPVALYGLAFQMWESSRGSSSDFLLARMSEKARATMAGDDLRGLGRLIPGYDQPASLPFNRHRFNAAVAAVEPEPEPKQPIVEEEPPANEEEDESGLGRLRRGGGKRRAEPAPAEEAETPRPRIEREDTTALLYDYHTLDFLHTTLRQCEFVRTELRKRPGGDAVAKQLAAAANTYVDAYFTDWFELYGDPTRLLDEHALALIEKCGGGGMSWPEFVEELTRPERDIATSMANRTEALVREVVFFDAGLEESDADDAVYERLRARLAELDRQQRSIPHVCVNMRRQRNMPSPSEGEPAVVYGGQIVSGWSEYVRQVRSLGPLTEETRKTTGQPPNVEQLAERMVYKQATTPQFPMIAPLIDVAEYGEKLLAHHLESRLAALFARHAGEYPLINLGEAHDGSALLGGIRGRKAVAPSEFIELLKLAAVFQQRYGDLYRDVQGDSPAVETLRRCAAWARFLYDTPDALLHGQSPRPRDVWVTIVRDNSGDVGNAANVYSKLTVTLPLLTTHGTAAPPIELATRSGEGITASSVQEAIGGGPAQYRWDMFVGSGVSYDPMTVAVSDKHPDARGDYPARVNGWSLPGNPWSLLMAMTARADNDLSDGYWKIPVRMETSDDPVGFLVGVKIGSRDRPFPGVIPPLAAPGGRPRMAQAAEYLSGRP